MSSALVKIALAATVLWPCATTAQTLEQRNVINHVAQVMVITNACPTLQPRMLLLAMLLKDNRIDLEKSPFRELVAERGAHHTRTTANYRREIICQSGLFLYGPNGHNVPHLIGE